MSELFHLSLSDGEYLLKCLWKVQKKNGSSKFISYSVPYSVKSILNHEFVFPDAQKATENSEKHSFKYRLIYFDSVGILIMTVH